MTKIEGPLLNVGTFITLLNSLASLDILFDGKHDEQSETDSEGTQQMELNESSKGPFLCNYMSCNDFIDVFVNSFYSFDIFDK